MATAAPAPMRDTTPPPYVASMAQLTSYAEVSEVLRSPHFVQGSHRESRPFFADSLLVLDGRAHFDRRRMEARLFSREALVRYEKEVLQPAIDRSLTDARAGGDGRGDLPALTRRMLLEMTAQITGIDGVDTAEATSRFHWFLDKIGEGSTVEWSTRDHDEVIAEVLAVRERFVEEFYGASLERRRELVARHRAGELAADELPLDLLTLLVLDGDPDWDPLVPLREATLYLVAGTQTTTHAVPHVVNHLHGWFLSHPGDRGRTGDLEFLQRATYESLRLHLPAPSLLRIASQDVVLGSGRRVAQGERVALLFTPANRDPAVFGDDAGEFNLLRPVEPPVKPWGLAFGGGRHTCIGRQLVTGLSRTFDDLGDEERATAGMAVQILQALYAAGAEPDPDRAPAYRAVSHHDAFDSYPLVFTAP